MKPNFALSLSFDGLRLMHRVTGGWHLVGQIALDDADLTGSLDHLRGVAEQLEPGGISTKILIPNDQIKYLALDTTRAEADDVRAALDGATPYAVDDLVYDFAKGGGRTYVAAVAKDTLSEAEQFAAEHGFNPVSFAAVPEPFTYVGEAFFGAVDGNSVERDTESVVVIGEADVPARVVPAIEDAPVEDTDAEDAVEPEVEEPKDTDPAEKPEDETVVEEASVDEAPSVEDPADDAPEAEPETPDPDEDPASDVEPEGDDTAAPDTTEDEAPDLDATADDDAEIPVADAAPMFASRLRADRDEGRPAPAAETPERSEPTFSRSAPPPLAVPTGAGKDPMPPLSAPSRAADAPAIAEPITTEAPMPEAAPAITGDAPTALSPEAAVSAASLAVETDPNASDDSEEEGDKGGAAAAALGAVGVVGGMFASRRMARAEAKTKAAEEAAEQAAAKPNEKSRLTVFGARKQPKKKEKIVVGGKPRFLGLILTAILLLFLLAFAAFAALSEEGIAAWFGFGSEDTQVAETPEAPTVDPDAVSEVAALPASDAPDPASAEDALATSSAPTGGQVLTPEEATRIYAATGVWQRAPRIPLTPRTTSLDSLTIGTMPRPVVRVPASPLATSSSVAGDAVIATPVDPPPPSQQFDFGDDGLIVATPEGAVTPDGILVITGAPPLNPPTRPGTVAPEITPQDQLAAVVPDTAVTLPDAPEGVIVIAGRPAIEPPIRPGTTAPAAAPEAAAIASGDAPLVARDGLLVLAGPPPILPPIRPGTSAPTAAPDVELAAVEPVAVEPAAPELPELGTGTETPAPEGLNVVAGAPPILPPARPGTVAPQAAADALSQDIAAALSTNTAQTATADTRRPLPRPASIVQAAAAVANTPVLGAMTAAQAAGFRPRTRPAGLAPVTPEPTPEPVPETPVSEPAPQQGLQIAPEIAAAVQAAANRPNPIVNPTAQAVPQSSRPDSRPRNMARIVARAQQAAERAATQVAAVAPRTVAPSGPTGGSVAQAATLDNAINLRDVNLIGIYGGSSDRRALVRLANGRYVRVTVGDRLDGGRVTAISASALSYTQRGRAVTLEVPG